MELKEGSAKWHTSHVGKEAPFFLQTSQWDFFFCEKNHTRLLHWPQQNKNFIPCPRKNRLKSVPGKLPLCNVPCQWEEWSSCTVLMLPKRSLDFFFAWELPPCILPVSSQLCNVLREKGVDFFFFCWSCTVLRPPQTGSYLFPVSLNFQKEPVWSQKRGCRQCSHATWMEGCYLCAFATFLPQSFFLSPSNPFRDLCLCLSVQQMPCFYWNNSKPLQGIEFILTIRNVCFPLPHFAKRVIMALCRTTHSSQWVCYTLIPFRRGS